MTVLTGYNGQLFFSLYLTTFGRTIKGHVCNIWQPQGPKIEARPQQTNFLAEISSWIFCIGHRDVEGFCIQTVCAITSIRKEKEAVVVGLRTK